MDCQTNEGSHGKLTTNTTWALVLAPLEKMSQLGQFHRQAEASFEWWDVWMCGRRWNAAGSVEQGGSSGGDDSQSLSTLHPFCSSLECRGTLAEVECKGALGTLFPKSITTSLVVTLRQRKITGLQARGISACNQLTRISKQFRDSPFLLTLPQASFSVVRVMFSGF